MHDIQACHKINGNISVGFPAMVYMVTNVSIAPVFPSITGLLVNVIVSLNNASTGVFLIFKLLYEKSDIELEGPGFGYLCHFFTIKPVIIMTNEHLRQVPKMNPPHRQ